MSGDRAPARILLVEDDTSFRRALAEVLAMQGYQILAAATAAEALEHLQSKDVDAVVTDIVMPGMRGEALLAEVRSTFPEIPMIAMTAFGSIEAALELTRAGAADYLAKPFRTEALLGALDRVLEETRPRRERARARRGTGEHLKAVIGASRPMRRLFDRIDRVATSRAPVFITGESGTGKELVAQSVHQASGRDPFVPVNCGALPDHLLESELFGHARGAFTGAHRDKPGLFEAAHQGTLFLDEIAEVPLALQPKLLRALEAGEVRRVGELQPRQVDVRLIAATNRDMPAALEAGRFREDLFWRLHVLHLHVPSLRERPTDVPLLVEEFLGRIAQREDGRELRVSPPALAALVEFSWPGNVRQMINILERAATFADGAEIDLGDLPPDLHRSERSAAIVRSAAQRHLTLEELEREYILEMLRITEGNKTRAAELLGIPRRTLYRRLTAYAQSDSDG